MTILKDLAELNKTLDQIGTTMGELAKVNRDTARTVEMTTLTLRQANLRRQAEKAGASCRTSAQFAVALFVLGCASLLFLRTAEGPAFFFCVLFYVPAVATCAASVSLRSKRRRFEREAQRAADRRTVLEVMR